MAWGILYIACQCCSGAPQPLGANAQFVYLGKYLFFQFPVPGMAIPFVQLPEAGFFSQAGHP